MGILILKVQRTSMSFKSSFLGFGGRWRFLTGVLHHDIDLDMVTGLWYTHILKYGSLSGFLRCKEHPCPLSPHFGHWRTLEVPDFGLASIPNPSQEPPVSSKAPNDVLKDMDNLFTFKIKMESQNSDHGCIKDHQPYPNQDQDAKPQSGTSSTWMFFAPSKSR